MAVNYFELILTKGVLVKNFNAEIVVEYSADEFIAMRKEKGFPGPFDDRILALTEDAA